MLKFHAQTILFPTVVKLKLGIV